MKSSLAFLFVLCTQVSTLDASATLYSYPSDAPRSDNYRVFVDGKETFVYENPIGSFVIFDMNGPVDIRIESTTIVRHVVARPLSAGVHPVWGGQAVELELESPTQLSVEFNGLLRDPLFIFAHPEIKRPEPGPKVRVFEAGRIHEPGVVHLRSNDHVFIEGGAVVRGLFLAENASNVTISGPGIIDASVQETLRFPDGYRTRVISLLDCEEVTLQDFCISDGRTWEIVPDRCRDVTIRNVNIVSNDGGDDGIDLVRSSQVIVQGCFIHTKDDCIAIKAHSPDAQVRGTHNVVIEGCVFWNTDWGNGFEIGFELRSERIHDITVRDCDFIHVEKGAVLSIHNADFAIVEDIHFENIRVEDARQKLLDFAILWTKYSMDGPQSESELTRRYQHGGVWDNVMNFDPGEKELYARNRGHIRNVTVRNLQIVDGGLPFSVFNGFDEDHLVRDIRLENIRLYERRLKTREDLKLFTEYAEEIHIE